MQNELETVPKQLKNKERDVKVKLEVELRRQLTIELRDSIAEEMREDLNEAKDGDESSDQKSHKFSNS